MIFGLFSVLGAAALVVIDQLIKHWATAALLPVGLLIGMTSVMLLVVLVMLFTRKMTTWERVAWTLVLGGGVGNLIDRVLNGVVVDYINVLFMHFAIFNFADICVCVGVGLLLLVVLLDSCKKEKPAEQKADDDGAA